jgi:predicted anti-sigma-YlaC factor YlaD
MKDIKRLNFEQPEDGLKHPTEWLAAYYDGELHGPKHAWVEEHLAGCPVCRAELEELEKLSSLLVQAPVPVYRTSPARFASQVMLRMDRTDRQTRSQKILKRAWQMLPLALVALWAVMQAGVFAGYLLSLTGLADAAGLKDTPGLAVLSPLDWLGPVFQEILGDLSWLIVNEALFGYLLIDLTLTALAGALLCTWIASYWAYQRRQA